MRNKLLCLTVLAAALFAGCETINDELPSYDATSKVRVGDVAPAVTITSLDGTELTMPNGVTTLLILFSHTCPDCKNMMSDLQQYLDSNESNFNVMTVSRGGTTQEIKSFVGELNLTFKVAADESKEIYYKYAEMYVPRCYVVDADGVIRYMTYEYQTGDVDRLIAELNTRNP